LKETFAEFTEYTPHITTRQGKFITSNFGVANGIIGFGSAAFKFLKPKFKLFKIGFHFVTPLMRGSIVSVKLFTSPQSSDCAFNRLHPGCPVSSRYTFSKGLGSALSLSPQYYILWAKKTKEKHRANGARKNQYAYIIGSMKGKINMENKLITVSGVTGYIDENGTAFLGIKDIAFGLGFTQSKNDVEYVRWETVNGYLSDLGFSQHVGKEFIPENIFYRLAMKASNKTAVDFQCKIADEILPAIRKTGTYAFKPMTQAELTAAIAQNQVEIEQKANAALEASNRTSRIVETALDALSAPPDTDWQIATGDKIKGMAQNYSLSYVVLFGDLYKELEHAAHVLLNSRVSRLQGRMKQAGATYKERQSVTKLHVIGLDPSLKLAFDGIVRRYNARYATDKISQFQQAM
jgi:prophage antirepressor-like protein